MVVSAVLEEDVGGWVLSGRQLDLALFLGSSVLWFLYHYSLRCLVEALPAFLCLDSCRLTSRRSYEEK